MIPANTLIEQALQIVNGVEPGLTGIDYGTVTPTRSTSDLIVNHSLGVKPSKVVIMQNQPFSYGPDVLLCKVSPMWNSPYNDDGMGWFCSTLDGSWKPVGYYGSVPITRDENTINFGSPGTTSATYTWIAIA